MRQSKDFPWPKGRVSQCTFVVLQVSFQFCTKTHETSWFDTFTCCILLPSTLPQKQLSFFKDMAPINLPFYVDVKWNGCLFHHKLPIFNAAQITIMTSLGLFCKVYYKVTYPNPKIKVLPFNIFTLTNCLKFGAQIHLQKRFIFLIFSLFLSLKWLYLHSASLTKVVLILNASWPKN